MTWQLSAFVLAGLNGGTKDLHAINMAFKDEDWEIMLLAHANNAFNSLNCQVANINGKHSHSRLMWGSMQSFCWWIHSTL